MELERLLAERTTLRKSRATYHKDYKASLEAYTETTTQYNAVLAQLGTLLKYPSKELIFKRRLYFGARPCTARMCENFFRNRSDFPPQKEEEPKEHEHYLLVDGRLWKEEIEHHWTRIKSYPITALVQKETDHQTYKYWLSYKRCNEENIDWKLDDKKILKNYLKYKKTDQTRFARKIQREWRRFLERPVYPNGKMGFHARKVWDQISLCCKEN